jgi:hypothetical protein
MTGQIYRHNDKLSLKEPDWPEEILHLLINFLDLHWHLSRSEGHLKMSLRIKQHLGVFCLSKP